MPYGQRYELRYCRKNTYPINNGLEELYIARIFQRGYISGGGIILTPAQVEDSTNLRVGGVVLSSTDGRIEIEWTAQLIDLYGKYPLVWGYYDGQLQPSIVPQLDNLASPTELIIDLGVIPATNLVLVLKKPDSETADATVGDVTIPISGFQFIWAYWDLAYQPSINPILDDNDTPTTATFTLMPSSGGSFIELKTPDAILTYTAAEMVTSGGIITISNYADTYGQYPKFQVYYDGQLQPLNLTQTPNLITIDLGALPSGNTHLLILNAGYATGITQLIGATPEPITIPAIQADPRDKMQPLMGSESTTRVMVGTDPNTGDSYGIDLEDIFTDDETEYYEEIQRITDEDTFTVNWSLDDNPGTLVDRDLLIQVNGVTVVNAFVPSSGSFQVTRGDIIDVSTSTSIPWPVVDNPYARLDVTGLVSQLTDDYTVVQTAQINGADKNYTIAAYTYYEADFIALRSEVFYNQTSAYPVTFSKIYHGADQATADADAAADPLFYTEGQAYADAWPIGFPAIWRGFLVMDAGTQQAFQATTYLELSFVDGIGLLKNYLFADAAGNYFTGKKTPKDIFYNCLNRIGIPDMNIYIHADVYEVSMDENEDPMVQVLMQMETYYLSTQSKPLDMGQVMESVGRNFKLDIRQNLGEWWITDKESLYNSGNRTYFKYSWITGEFLEQVEYDPTVTLGCVTGSFNTIFALADGMKIIDRAYRGQILRYEYKAAQQINENPNLTPEASGGGFIWPGWTVDPLGSGNVNPGPDNNGARIDSNATRPADPSVITMTSDNIAVEPGDLLSFDFNFNNAGPVAFAQYAIVFTNGAVDYYLDTPTGQWIQYPPGTFTLQYVYNGQVLNNPAGPVPPGDYLYALDSDLSFTVTADGIPGILAGNVNIILYNYDYSQNNSLIGDETNTPEYPDFAGTTTWNLAKASFVIPEDASGEAVGTFYIAANVGNPTFTPEILPVLNADDQTARYVGTLYKASAPAEPTTYWHRGGLPGYGEFKPLMWIIAEAYVRMYQQKFRIFQGTIYIWVPQLSRFTIDGWPGVYMLVGADYNLGSNLHSVNIIQISNEDIIGAPATIEEIDYGQYSDGDLPVIITG